MSSKRIQPRIFWQEKYRAEQLAAEMNSSLKEKFLQLQKENVEQSRKVATRQAELDSLLKKKAHMGDQVYISPVSIRHYVR